ncbi:hypothetical protein B0T17DRAFT_512617 [Bombardia bombarda]|uniref:Uncharacterized protein n=1 Tax=Bombardia bombarda TaxID=252184 RepID=A0AA39TLI3_9PEZI|nr:hypothetical protein B0T17DRAFT_512617 [Bombardia bombarda]
MSILSTNYMKMGSLSSQMASLSLHVAPPAVFFTRRILAPTKEETMKNSIEFLEEHVEHCIKQRFGAGVVCQPLHMQDLRVSIMWGNSWGPDVETDLEHMADGDIEDLIEGLAMYKLYKTATVLLSFTVAEKMQQDNRQTWTSEGPGLLGLEGHRVLCLRSDSASIQWGCAMGLV